MTRWNEMIGEQADALRDAFCRAAATAHVENGQRYAPDDLGDNARIYGISTSNSARFLAGREIEDMQLDGVLVCERGLVWWVEIDRAALAPLHVYFYKAPPGATKIDDLRLDDAEVKRQLSRSNGRQLDLFTRSGAAGHADLLSVIIVHYGDPVTGPGKLDVGAPYLNGDELAWDWHERFDLRRDEADETTARSPLGNDDGGFEGLRLIEPVDDDVAQPEIPQIAPAAGSSNFGGMKLLDPAEEDETGDDEGRHGGAGKESS